METGTAFLTQSREYLTAHYLPKIQAALEQLPEADLWWRPNPASNAIGNLMLHLAGNIRQWIVGGVGGKPGDRDRPSEFAATAGRSRRDLLALLTQAVLEVDEVLAGTDPASLHERREIQGRECSVLEAIYHVVEHFGMHTGQIILLTKARTAEELKLWRPVSNPVDEVVGILGRPLTHNKERPE